MGYAVAQLIEALRYNPEARGLDSRWRLCHTMALGSTQPLTPHVNTDLVVPPPGCGRSVTDFYVAPIM
jgi:hypothetical protein